MEILQSEQGKDEGFGPPVTSAVAGRLEKLMGTPMSKDFYEKLKSKLQVPENCKLLAVPKLNHEIWGVLNQQSRTVDT